MNDTLHLERSPITGNLELIRPREYKSKHLFQFVFAQGAMSWNFLSHLEKEEIRSFVRERYERAIKEEQHVAAKVLGNWLVYMYTDTKPCHGEYVNA